MMEEGSLVPSKMCSSVLIRYIIKLKFYLLTFLNALGHTLLNTLYMLVTNDTFLLKLELIYPNVDIIY